MHLFFIDESGTATAPDKHRNKYFVIGGVIVPEGHWLRMRDMLQGLKFRRKLRGEIKWRFFAPGNDDEENPMRGMDSAERDSIRSEIYSRIICCDRSITTIACVCCIEQAYKLSSINTRDDLYYATYKPVSERFQYYLQDLSRSVGRAEFGIIVSDHRGAQDDSRFRTNHESLVASGGSQHSSDYRNIVESIFLQPSHLSVGIQMADMVAGAIWRKFETGDDRWFKLIEHTIRRSPAGSTDGHGIVKLPKQTWI